MQHRVYIDKTQRRFVYPFDRNACIYQ